MTHCHRCLLTDRHPGIEIDESGLCNLCALRLPEHIVDNFTFTRQNHERFLASTPTPDADYDCLFLYSGGKDSTYMLDRFVNGEGRRVLAYTFNVPFESKYVEENIERARAAIDIDYVIDSDDDGIRKMMGHIFNSVSPERPGAYLDEKKPCMMCRTFFVIRSILFAWREGIPFIILCGDPQQIVTMESDVRRVIGGFFRDVGEEMTLELFGEDIMDVLVADDDELPTIVFPYIAHRHDYDPDRMVRELKEKGLYASSPLETHCTLFPLLNYYAFTHYDCSFYKLNMSAQRRANELHGGSSKATFGLDFATGDDLLEIEAKYKSVIFDVVARSGTREAQHAALMDVFAEMQVEVDAAEYLADKYLSLHEIAADLGIELPLVGAQGSKGQ